MKKLLIVLFVLSVVLYSNANTNNETAQSNFKEPITTFDLPYIH